MTDRGAKYKYGRRIYLDADYSTVRLSVSNNGCTTQVDKRSFHLDRGF